MEDHNIEKIVPDTSVIIEGALSKLIGNNEIIVNEIIIHNAVLSELEHQANENKSSGFLGLDEIKRLNKLKEGKGFEIRFIGKKPSAGDIRFAGWGEIDALIRESAYEEDARLFTADKVQARVAEAKGIKVLFAEISIKPKILKLDSYFDNITMSVHLRENVEAFAKKGKPGEWAFEKIGKNKLTREEIQDVSREIIEEANIRKDGFVEIERPGSTIVQLGNFRIVITVPPFSDGWEITAVRPVKRLGIDDYKLSEKLLERVKEQAEGILISGSPGMGKSTFAQALAEFYANQGKIVKTIEAPRDLILEDNVTQYAISHGTPQEIHDILLLSRPDYTLFDEMRNTEDFKLFADLRLSGIGLAGVVHGTNPIDAVQRFVGRIELGVIPHVIDTVIFIKNGTVDKVLNLQMVVKVPAGMTEADLARPVVTVNDFETGAPEFEMYSYGEETVVIPISAIPEQKEGGAKKLAAAEIERKLQKHADVIKVKVLDDNNCILYVPKRDVASIIGKQGRNVMKLEKEIGMHIDVEELSEAEESEPSTSGEKVAFGYDTKGKSVKLLFDDSHTGQNVDTFIAGEFLFSANIGKNGEIKIKKNNKLGKVLLNALKYNERIEVRLVD